MLGAAGVAHGQQPPLYLLTYDHGGLVLWGLDHFAQRLRDALAWLDRYPGFKIGLDNEGYTYDYLAEHDPKLLRDVRDALARYPGRFGIGTCTYGQPLTTFINEESNIRQIGMALEADRRHFGSAPNVYLMSEHAMHAQTPQILAGFGFRSAIMRTHYMMYGYNPVFDAPVGWWTSPDGSRIAAVPTYKGEGAEFGRTTSDNWILTRCPGPDCKGSLAEFRAQFSHIQPTIATRADDSGLRREGLLRETEGRPEYRWILLEDLRQVLPEPKVDFKTGPNDFTVRMPWGYCGNEIWNRNRQAEAKVLTAERLAALELMSGGEDREAAIEKAWKNLLVGQHHDVQICGLLPEARRFLGEAVRVADQVSEASLRNIAANMLGGATAQVTVFNPSSWPRREWVQTTFTLPRHWGTNLEVRCGERVVPSTMLSSLRASDESLQEATVALLADPPGLGFASYAVFPASQPAAQASGIQADESRLTIANQHWNIRLASEGGIAGIESRRTGAPILKSEGRSLFFAGRINGEDRESAGKWRILPSPAGAGWVTAREEGAIGGIPYRFELTAWADSPRLDCRVRFEFEGQKIGLLSENRRDSHSPFQHEHKLRLKLRPAAGAGATGIRDLPFIIAETAAKNVEGNYWSAVSDGRTGVAVFNRGTMGTVRETDGSFSVPLAYSMYYIWGTRMLSGEYTYELALYPFEGPWQAAGLHRRAIEFSFPLASVAAAPGNGRLGSVYQPVEVSCETALVSALASNRGQIFLRMYEHSGQSAAALVRVADLPRLTEVDLAGSPRGAVASPAPIRPWQILTLRLDR